MKEFEENNPEQLRKFLTELRVLIDKYHPNIYLMDDLFVGLNHAERAIIEEIHKNQEKDENI